VIVADTNLLVYLLLPGDHTDEAERVWRKDREWAVPPLWRSEFRNVLAGYLRKRLLTKDDALEAFSRAEVAVQSRELAPSTARVLDLVEQSTCSAYDCEFAALAQELSVALVTSDTRLLGNFPGIAVSPSAFSS
jgi:predicted nucleic acid-binding protein